MTTIARLEYQREWQRNKRAELSARLDVWRFQTVHQCPHCDAPLALSWESGRRVKYCYCQTPEAYILEYS